MADPALVALAERLQGICIGRRLTVATAESCTGGLVGEAITAVPGSSAYFVGALVTYADEAKTAILGVPTGTVHSRLHYAMRAMRAALAPKAAVPATTTGAIR